MGVEIKIEGLTKSFGKQLIWGDVTLTVPAGEICVMLGPSGTGKSVLLKTLIGLLKPDRGSVVIEGTDITTCPERELYEIRKLFGVLFQDGAMFGSMNLYDNVAFPLREHTKKSESEIRAVVMEKMDLVGLIGAETKLPGRDLRRHAQAGRPGPRPRARPRDRAVRRARLRARPGAHVVPQPADRRPQRPDRRDVPDRHPRHQHRAHGARQHRPALPPPPGDVRAARDAAQLRGAGRPPVPQRPDHRPDRHVGGEGRRRPRRRGRARSCLRCRPSRCSRSRPTASPGAASARRASGARRTASRLLPGPSRRT